MGWLEDVNELDFSGKAKVNASGSIQQWTAKGYRVEYIDHKRAGTAPTGNVTRDSSGTPGAPEYAQYSVRTLKVTDPRTNQTFLVGYKLNEDNTFSPFSFHSPEQTQIILKAQETKSQQDIANAQAADIAAKEASVNKAQKDIERDLNDQKLSGGKGTHRKTNSELLDEEKKQIGNDLQREQLETARKNNVAQGEVWRAQADLYQAQARAVPATTAVALSGANVNIYRAMTENERLEFDKLQAQLNERVKRGELSLAEANSEYNGRVETWKAQRDKDKFTTEQAGKQAELEQTQRAQDVTIRSQDLENATKQANQAMDFVGRLITKGKIGSTAGVEALLGAMGLQRLNTRAFQNEVQKPLYPAIPDAIKKASEQPLINADPTASLNYGEARAVGQQRMEENLGDSGLFTENYRGSAAKPMVETVQNPAPTPSSSAPTTGSAPAATTWTPATQQTAAEAPGDTSANPPAAAAPASEQDGAAATATPPHFVFSPRGMHFEEGKPQLAGEPVGAAESYDERVAASPSYPALTEPLPLALQRGDVGSVDGDSRSDFGVIQKTQTETPALDPARPLTPKEQQMQASGYAVRAPMTANWTTVDPQTTPTLPTTTAQWQGTLDTPSTAAPPTEESWMSDPRETVPESLRSLESDPALVGQLAPSRKKPEDDLVFPSFM